MTSQQLQSKVRQAIKEYNMIESGDRIAIGLSGGKDSLVMLYALAMLRHFYPVNFELIAVTVDLGFDGNHFNDYEALCQSLDVPYYVVPTQIAHIVFDVRKESNPCSLCSKMRKGALNDKALQLGCNKIAYAHHLDDAVDTMMLSLIYEGRFQSLEPVIKFDHTGLTLIRPLLFLREAEIKGFLNKNPLPVHQSLCPADKHTKREEIKELLQSIEKVAPGAKKRMFTAICNTHYKNLPWKEEK